MRYTKPHVLATLNANTAIQAGDDKNIKSNPTVLDAVHVLSTTAAYPADE